MKLKRLFSVLGLGLFAVASVSAGVLAFAKGPKVEQAKAEVTETSDWYYASEALEWDKYQIRLSVDSENDNEGQLMERYLVKGETFKFKYKTTWDGALGYSALAGGSARSAFKEAATDGNFEVKATGTYNFFINKSKQVFVEFINAATIYVQIKGWTNTYVYAFDETSEEGVTLEPLGAWPGKRIENGTTNIDFGHGWEENPYNVGGGIGKIDVPYLAISNTKIILNDNEGGHKSIAEGGVSLDSGSYYHNGKGEYTSQYGALARVAYDVSKAIDGAEDQSTCKMSKSVASDLYDEYYPYWSYTILNASLVESWVDPSRGSTKTYTFEEIMERIHAVATAPDPDPAHIISGVVDNNATWIVVITSVTTVSLVALFFVVRRKKHN